MSRRFAHLSDVEIFVTIIEKGSLTAAAVALATTASVLSRALTRLGDAPRRTAGEAHHPTVEPDAGRATLLRAGMQRVRGV